MRWPLIPCVPGVRSVLTEIRRGASSRSRPFTRWHRKGHVAREQFHPALHDRVRRLSRVRVAREAGAEASGSRGQSEGARATAPRARSAWARFVHGARVTPRSSMRSTAAPTAAAPLERHSSTPGRRAIARHQDRSTGGPGRAPACRHSRERDAPRRQETGQKFPTCRNWTNGLTARVRSSGAKSKLNRSWTSEHSAGS